MYTSLFDSTPLLLIFVLTVGFIQLMVEVGFRVGEQRARKSDNERQTSIDSIVGSTLGLLAFVLAFTFSMATARFDERKQLVLEDMVASRTVDLRAQLLPAPHRSEIRPLIREYVDVRIKGALDILELPKALSRSEELQRELWTHATVLMGGAASAPAVPAFVQSVIQLIDVHSKRVNDALYNRIPETIWIALYLMSGLAMAITGYRAGLAGGRSVIATLVMVLAFSALILLITDLDRPQEGFLKVSQRAMIDLQTQLHREQSK